MTVTKAEAKRLAADLEKAAALVTKKARPDDKPDEADLKRAEDALGKIYEALREQHPDH